MTSIRFTNTSCTRVRYGVAFRSWWAILSLETGEYLLVICTAICWVSHGVLPSSVEQIIKSAPRRALSKYSILMCDKPAKTKSCIAPIGQ